jgi:PHD/YefM family antitoxin component YafN of YafNO toxin-antitoxin module
MLVGVRYSPQPMIRVIHLAKLQRHLDRLVKQAHRRGRRAVVVDHRTTAAAVVPIADLARLRALAAAHGESYPPMRVVSLEYAGDHAEELLRLVCRRRVWVLIHGDGEPLAAIIPMAHLRQLNGSAQAPIDPALVRQLRRRVIRELEARDEIR